MVPLGTAAPEFTLPDPSGRIVSKKDFLGKPLLVAFICNHCPYVKHIRHEFADFAEEYMARDVAIVGINSNDVTRYPDDHPDKMAEEIRNIGYCFPYLHDETQEVARSYGAACTPDFFLFNSDHRLVYRGQFDGSRPGSGIPVTGKDLRLALEAVLEGKDVSNNQVPSIGCNIKWKPGNEP